MAQQLSTQKWGAIRRSLSLRLSLLTALVLGLVIGSLGWIARDRIQTAIEEQWQDELANRLDSMLAYREVLALTAIDPALYGELYSGNYWEMGSVESGMALPENASISLADFSLIDQLTAPWQAASLGRDFVRMQGPLNEPLLALITRTEDGSGWFLMARDASDLDRLLNQVHRQTTLVLALIALSAVMASAAVILLGARPVRQLALELTELDSGKRRRINTDLPTEIAPLASTLNRVLAAQETRIRRQRESAANLAHELKTPLAILQQQAELADTVPAELVAEKVNRMWVPLEQELARARVHGPAPGLEPTLVNEQVDRAIRLCCSDHPVAHEDFRLDIPDSLRLPLEERDLFTIIWNLLDNAVRHGGVPVTVQAQPQLLRIRDSGANGIDKAGTPAPQNGGAGLRLVSHILDAYGWVMQVHPDPGGGRLCTLRPDASR